MTKFVIFEGCDGSGKSTLYQAFRRATAYQVLCIDRFIGSQIVYDEIYDREDKKEYWATEEVKLTSVYDVYLVLMTAPESVILERIKAKETQWTMFCCKNNQKGGAANNCLLQK